MLIKEKKKYRSRKISVRLTEEEFNEIRIKAKLYCKDSISSFVRHVAFNYIADVGEEKEGLLNPSDDSIKDKPQEHL